jgi:hypothetical protein
VLTQGRVLQQGPMVVRVLLVHPQEMQQGWLLRLWQH